MKTCPIHDDFEYPDTLPECPACTRDRRLAKQDRTPEAPARASPLLEPTAGSSTVAGAPKRAQGATVSSNAQPRTGTEHQAGDSGTEHQEVDSGAERPATYQDIQDLVDSGVNIIVMLGFRSAGKSWFVNRLKFKLSSKDYDCDPPHVKGGAILGRSNAISRHRFDKEGGTKSESFAIIDMMGESFRLIAGGQGTHLREHLLALKHCSALILVIPAHEALLGERASTKHPTLSGETPDTQVITSSALASTTKGAKQKEKKSAGAAPAKRRSHIVEAEDMSRQEHNLGTLMSSMKSLRAYLKVLETHTVDEVVTLGDLGVERLAGKAEVNLVDKPMFIALTKSDIIETWREAALSQTEGERSRTTKLHVIDYLLNHDDALREDMGDYYRDPRDTVARFRRGMLSRTKGFSRCKIDFVTASRDPERPSPSDRTMRYVGTRDHGVDAVINWIRWVGRLHTRASAPRDWRKGFETLDRIMEPRWLSMAVWLRRYRDEGRLFAANSAEDV